MDHALYTAMNAANATLQQQAVTANNLANVATPGFRAQIALFRSVPVVGPSLPTRVLSTASTPSSDFSPGAINHTGRALDVAVGQNGWLAVQLPDGTEGYTRNGNLQVDANGQLMVQGHPLLGSNGPLEVPLQSSLTIASDGTISALIAGSNSNTPIQVGQLKLVKAEGNDLIHGEDGFFHPSPEAQQQKGAVLPADPSIHVTSGALEGSNVSSIQSMIDMINNARQFDMQMQVVSNVSDNDKSANQLLNLS